MCVGGRVSGEVLMCMCVCVLVSKWMGCDAITENGISNRRGREERKGVIMGD